MSETGRNDAARSANDRMKALARAKGGNINANIDFIRRRFAYERLLSRLSAAGYDDRWMLKGGVLMLALETDTHRTTQDIDFTLRGGAELEAVVKALGEICATSPNPEDGMTYSIEMTRAKEVPRIIGEFRDRPTVRVTIQAVLHTERPVPLSFVVDATAAELDHAPVLRRWAATVRGFDAIDIPSYPWEVVVAEKMHAVMTGTERNPRLRDYGDLIALARSGQVDLAGAALEIERVFAVRGDAGRFDPEAAGLSDAFAKARQSDWKGTLAVTGYAGSMPAGLADAIVEVRAFAEAIARMAPLPGITCQ